jgi:antirestriction protein ArdC
MLEEGTAPWQKPWEAGEAGRMPWNPVTGKPYRGGNVIGLMVAGMRKGYSDSRWMTYRQAAEKGWQVRKGEKASNIEYWESKPGSKAEDADDDERKSRLVHKVYAVFNAEQIDGIPPLEVKPKEAWEVCETGERIMKDSGADVRYGGDRAYYNRKDDYIRLPNRDQFPDAPSFYGTSLHELGHWTGHPSRLNRATLTDSYRFGDQNYSLEELVSELTSLYIAAETGIPNDPKQHAAYVASWIKALKDDKNAIFKAASAASAAADYLLQHEKRAEVEEPQTSLGPTHVERLQKQSESHSPSSLRRA